MVSGVIAVFGTGLFVCSPIGSLFEFLGRPDPEALDGSFWFEPDLAFFLLGASMVGGDPPLVGPEINSSGSLASD